MEHTEPIQTFATGWPRMPAPPAPPPPPITPLFEILLWIVLFLEIGYLCITLIDAILDKLIPSDIETIVLAAHESIKLSLPINQQFHIIIDSTKDIYVMDGITIAEQTHSLKWESWNYKDVIIITQEDLNLYGPKKLGILTLDNIEISKITDECKDIFIKIEGKKEPPANFLSLGSNEKYYLIIKNE
jgi:hypothetical protein